MNKFKRNFIRYTDAGLPVIYVDTLEDDRAKDIVFEICRDVGRDIVE